MKSELQRIDGDIKVLNDGILQAQSQLDALDLDNLKRRKAEVEKDVEILSAAYARGEITIDEVHKAEKEFKKIQSTLRDQEAAEKACKSLIKTNEAEIEKLQNQRTIAERKLLRAYQADRIEKFQKEHLAEVLELAAFNSVIAGYPYIEFLARVLFPMGGLDAFKSYQDAARETSKQLIKQDKNNDKKDDPDDSDEM